MNQGELGPGPGARRAHTLRGAEGDWACQGEDGVADLPPVLEAEFVSRTTLVSKLAKGALRGDGDCIEREQDRARPWQQAAKHRAHCKI